MKTVIFDLFDTILDKVHFDYFAGLHDLYDRHLSNITSYEDLEGKAFQYRNRFMLDRGKTNRETPFIDQLVFFENSYPGLKLKDKGEIEWRFFQLCRKEEKAPNVDAFLAFLKSHGYRSYVISNTIFSAATLRKYLAQFQIEAYFDNVYSSADIIHRKPSPEIFRYVLKQEKIEIKEDTYFIGNSLEKDLRPAEKLGLTPIFRNRLNEPFDGFSFLDYKDATAYFKGIEEARK